MNEIVDILLVDDDPRNLDALEAILEDPNYRLLRAENADVALRLLLDHNVAAIVLDIKMPGTSGFELAQMIKATKRYREIPILFLTAYLVGDEDVLTGYGAGAVDYMMKPLNPQIVRRKIAVFADLFRKTRALAELNETLEARVAARTAELEQSEAALRAADRKKDEFLATLAHELRNPLAPLRFGINILEKQPVAGEAPLIGKTLAAMDRQLSHLVRLVDDLLDMARISRGTIGLQKDYVDLGRVVETAVDMSRPHIERRGHTLTVDGTPAVFTNGDPTRLAQIIGNLLHNAAKFMPAGGNIAVALTRDGDSAIVRVTDHGEGIAADQLEDAFAMFARIQRADSTAERGLGIGLALGRRLAELHGGTLTGSSAGMGRGATFTLRLPAVAEPARVARVERQHHAATEILDIVVIEDIEDVAETLALCLEEMGHRVSVALTGARGIALIQEKKPDVVLCDLGLPEMDGIEVCRRVRSLPLDRQPVMIALTGWGREEDRQRTHDAGFDKHLVKPVAVNELAATLSSVATMRVA